jgi:hypothetical protein
MLTTRPPKSAGITDIPSQDMKYPFSAYFSVLNKSRHSLLMLMLECLPTIPYFSIDNARVICTKDLNSLKNEHDRYTLERYER